MRWFPRADLDPHAFVGRCESCYATLKEEPGDLTPAEVSAAEAIVHLSGYDAALDWLRQAHPNLLVLTPSRTAYHTEVHGTDEDPNHSFYVCVACSREYHEHWDDQWAAYYADVV